MRVLATGLCGSDLHYYNHFRNGDIVVLEPLTLGHESVGEVVAQGWSQTETATDPSSRPGGHKLKVGDFVALEVGKPCEVCDLCTSGRYNICPLMRFRSSAKGGAPHAQGTLQERINMPARWCHPLPFSAASVSSSTSAAGLSEALSPTVSLDVGALIEPLAVAVHARSRAECAGAGRAQTALVFGAGAVGLLCCAVNKAAPAVRTVVVADIQAERVQFALDRGLADVGVVVPMRRPETVEEKLEFAREVAGLVKGAKGDTAIGDIGLVYECTGVETCLQAAIYVRLPIRPTTM